MRTILGRTGQHVLEEFAHGNVVAVFDFDGTLAPIVRSPAAAAMRPSTRRLLDQLTRFYPCAVTSGRARADLAHRLEGVRLDCYLGNHGLELGGQHGDWKQKRRRLRAWAAALRAVAIRFPGTTVEDKGVSLTVHVRNATDRDAARRATREAARHLEGARLVAGREAVNVLPREGVSKAEVLRRVRALFGCDAILYVGDGDGDEEVFAEDDPYGLLAIRVGAHRGAGRWCLPSQRDVDELLQRLIDARCATLRDARSR